MTVHTTETRNSSDATTTKEEITKKSGQMMVGSNQVYIYIFIKYIQWWSELATGDFISRRGKVSSPALGAPKDSTPKLNTGRSNPATGVTWTLRSLRWSFLAQRKVTQKLLGEACWWLRSLMEGSCQKLNPKREHQGSV